MDHEPNRFVHHQVPVDYLEDAPLGDEMKHFLMDLTNNNKTSLFNLRVFLYRALVVDSGAPTILCITGPSGTDKSTFISL